LIVFEKNLVEQTLVCLVLQDLPWKCSEGIDKSPYIVIMIRLYHKMWPGFSNPGRAPRKTQKSHKGLSADYADVTDFLNGRIANGRMGEWPLRV